MTQENRPAMRSILRDPVALARNLKLDPQDAAVTSFPLRVPEAFSTRIEKGNPQDPLLLQIWPSEAERVATPGYGTDPVGDSDSEQIPGLLSKYKGRVLLIASGACAINCRYCFRRHFPYAGHQASRDNWSQAVAYLEQHSDVTEVILSGGDPLMLATERLRALTEQLDCIPHIQRLRIHTRIPVVMPERIDPALLDWLEGLTQKGVVVLHVNHARELGSQARQAIDKLSAAGLVLLNQSVLLAQINDHPQTLAELSHALFHAGVLPYYLHQLDPVAGAAHFQVSDQRAREIHTQLREMVSGYLLPKLVREKAGRPSKEPL